MLKEAKNTSKFFKCVGSAHNSDNSEASDGPSVKSIYEALSEGEYEAVRVPAIDFSVIPY